MQRAFVIQLNPQSCPASFDGRIEHVDSGQDGRFHSPEELLLFIEEVLNETWQAEQEETQQEPPPN